MHNFKLNFANDRLTGRDKTISVKTFFFIRHCT